MKTSACRDGTLKNQPNKMGTTPQHIHTIPTSCAILPTMHNKKLSTHSLIEHGTQNCSLHSRPHKIKSISDSATFSSNIISHHNLKLPTYHTDLAHLVWLVFEGPSLHALVFIRKTFLRLYGLQENRGAPKQKNVFYACIHHSEK